MGEATRRSRIRKCEDTILSYTILSHIIVELFFSLLYTILSHIIVELSSYIIIHYIITCYYRIIFQLILLLYTTIYIISPNYFSHISLLKAKQFVKFMGEATRRSRIRKCEDTILSYTILSHIIVELFFSLLYTILSHIIVELSSYIIIHYIITCYYRIIFQLILLLYTTIYIISPNYFSHISLLKAKQFVKFMGEATRRSRIRKCEDTILLYTIL